MSRLTGLEANPDALRGLKPLSLGFLGVGWIGLNRLQAIAATGLARTLVLVDPSEAQRRRALEAVPSAEWAPDLPALLERDLDGLVIATPSALHAAQSMAALERGLAVFCQKPLGRSARETRAVVDAAQAANRLLAVDLSYRFTAAVRRLREIIRAGGLGRVYALDLVFHNAYGPDKPWFYDPALSGGGCVMDLGVHLVDLALWLLGFPKVLKVTSSLWSRAAPLEAALRSAGGAVEDYAVAALELEGEVIVRLACSWNLHAGRPAEISAAVHGSTAGARFRNVDGSFYDFALELNHGPSCETLLSPPDDWGGRAAAAFARRLAEGQRYDPRARDLVAVSEALDAIYAAAGPRPSPPLEGARGPSEGPHP